MTICAAAETDVGKVKSTNQDSVCIKIASTPKGEIAMAVVCDGMGGLQKGELASATVIRAFSNWFERELPERMSDFDWNYVCEQWNHMIKTLNRTIGDYGKFYGMSLGTTVTAMLVFNGEYAIGHVGDSRAYEIQNLPVQLTEDHSFVAREVKRGVMTAEEAERDPRKNVLLQCVGASKSVVPQLIRGQLKPNVGYLLCSDGFRHLISPTELGSAVGGSIEAGVAQVKSELRRLINTAMSRGESDNISALVLWIKE